MEKIIGLVGVAIVWSMASVQILAAPAQPGGGAVTAAQRSEIEKAVTAAITGWTAAMNALDPERCMKHYSLEFQERVGGGNIAPANPGREAMAKWVSDLQSQRSSQTFQWSTIKVHPLSPDLAYSVMVGGGSFAFKKTGRIGGLMTALTVVWRKESDGWKIIHVHESWW